jgi:hypothetical protein
MAHPNEVIQARNVNILSLLGSVSLSGNGEKYGPCPMCAGNDRFHVKNNKWFCSHCTGRPGDGNGGAWHGPIDLAMALYNVDFRTAVTMLTSRAGPSPAPLATRQASRQASRQAAPPLPWQNKAHDAAFSLAEKLLCNERARNWLNKRGIDYQAIIRYNLGYTAGGNVGGLWFGLGNRPERGIVIPHWSQRHQTMFGLNVRRPVGDPKYYHAKGSKIPQGLYNSDSLTGNEICFVTEGEFDTIALHSQISDLAAVVTLGARDAKLADRWLPDLAHIKRFVIVTDCGEDDRAANNWLKLVGDRGRRMILPGGAKDICEAYQNGLDLRDWAMAIMISMGL